MVIITGGVIAGVGSLMLATGDVADTLAVLLVPGDRFRESAPEVHLGGISFSGNR